MYLKNYLKQTIDNNIDSIKDDLQKNEDSKRLLEETSMNKAQYEIFIHSAWKNEGEKDVKGKYFGSIPEAIKQAEKKFERINNRKDIDGEYIVSIILGDKTFDIPRKYWSKYIRK